FGPVSGRARVNRVTGGLSLGLELPAFPLGEAATGAADRVAPGLARHLTGLSGAAAVSADLTYAPDAAKKWRHDVRLDLKDARFTHPDVPWPVEKIAASVRVVDGRVKVDDATAQVAGSAVKLSLETRAEASGGREPPDATGSGGSRPPLASGDALARAEDQLQRFDLTVSGVALDDNLFKHLPD